jgi:hypothetical protein
MEKTFFQIFICFKHFYIFVAPKWEGRSTVEECYLIILLLRASSIKLQASKMPRWQDRARRNEPVAHFREGPGCRGANSAIWSKK